MTIHSLRREQWIPRPLEDVFRFFSDARNLETITPPFLRFAITTPQPIRIQRGTVLDYRLKWHGVPVRWRTKIVAWHPPRGFVDVQITGPYKFWRHSHLFVTDGKGTCMVDSLSYRLPFGMLGSIAHAAWVRRDVESIFNYRRDRIAEIFPPQSGR